MIYLDGFSGYGGFRHAFELEGWKFDKVYFSEIDKYAIANYKHNFPESEYAGSITDVSGLPKIDLFTFGWPCQDNSLGGKRKGQTGDSRSGLLFKAVECIKRFKPRNFVAENVVGLLSVNGGIDIIESLKLLSYLNDSCPQYDIEMQLLNTRWFLPQRRERLFFVGHLRGSGSTKIFPIGETGFGNAITGNNKEKDVACTLTTRSAKSRLGCDYTIVKVKSGTTDGYELAEKGVSQTLLTKTNQCVVLGDNLYRDFTPKEYERLQGLPDNWTKYGNFNGEIKEISDSQRYKMIGNGVSIPPVREIAKRLKF